MSSIKILDSETGKAIVDLMSNEIATKYKTEAKECKKIVRNLILGNKTILELVATGKPLKQITKSKAFKTIRTNARRKVYNQLRQYNLDETLQKSLLEKLDKLSPDVSEDILTPLLQQIAQTHVSTKERLEEQDFFYQKLFELVGRFESIMDIGCGIAPIVFPFNNNNCFTKTYLALEKDTKSIEVLHKFKKFVPQDIFFEAPCWNIQENWFEIIKAYPAPFDVAFMFKLIPVVKRNTPDLLEILMQAPAKKWVVSGSRLAMAKKENIERRERRVIEAFVRESGKEIIGEFSLQEEFFLVLD